jgi:DnaK suppressor protein
MRTEMIRCVEDVRAHLEKEHKRLSDELVMKEGLPIAGGPEANPVGDRGEMAVQAFERQRRHILLRRTKGQLAEVERALEKIAKGTYGLCDSCGETIPSARLEILPQTGFCAGCKARRRG